MKKLVEKFGKKKVYAAIGVVAVIILFLLWFMFSQTKASFKVVTKNEVISEFGEDLDWTKLFDARKSDQGVKVKEVKNFDKDVAGDQKIDVVFQKDSKTKTEKITVIVKDTVKPEFIDFKDEIVIEQGAENVKLEDYFIAKDKAEVKITVEGKVDLNKAGKYDVKVTAEDANNNKTDAKSCVVVVASAKDVADGKKLTATVKGEVPLSKDTQQKVEKGEVKLNIEKPSEETKEVVKEQDKIVDENKNKPTTNNNSNTNSTTEEKKDNNKTEPNKNENVSSGTDSKPEGNGSSSNNSNSNSNGSTNTKPEESKPSHTHDWKAVYKTVHHEEQGHNEKYVIKDAWDEQVPKYEKKSFWVCYDDGELMETENELTIHGKKHMFGELPGDGDYYVDYRNVQVGTETNHHEAEYGTKWVVDKKAYDEKVLDHYECSCGQTKK